MVYHVRKLLSCFFLTKSLSAVIQRNSRHKELKDFWLLACRFTGGQPRLCLTQETALKQFIKDNTKRTAIEVVSHIKKEYGVVFSIIGATKLLHRLGFAYKKPKVVPGKTNAQKQADILTKYEKIKARLKEKDEVYFLDSSLSSTQH